MLLGVGVLGALAYCAIGFITFWTLMKSARRLHAGGYALCAGIIVLAAVEMMGTSVPLEPSLLMLSCLIVVARLGFVAAHER